MIYLSAIDQPPPIEADRWPVGMLLTPATTTRPQHGLTWAADTGAERDPLAFSLRAYLAWLEEWRAYRMRCLFACAPSVRGDGRATIERAIPVLPRIRALGFRAALIAMDGIGAEAVPWGQLDALVIGGRAAWQVSLAARKLELRALAEHKWVHRAHCTGWRELKASQVAGAHSVDGCFLAFQPASALAAATPLLTRSVTPLLPAALTVTHTATHTPALAR